MLNSNNQTEVVSRQSNQDGWSLMFGCWLIVSVATLGSLFLDKALGIEPCSLCWYQRIFMYPLAVILLIGLLPLDRHVTRYALPLAILGWLTATYHLLMYAGIIPESLQPCGSGPSCVQDDLGLFGFVNIPMLSLLSFSAVIGLLLVFNKRTKQ
ncbi:MAG: disulfide bond formation protein B [Gammaproteobacteria bacterium]|jgi:disulfide bond formation protein DsbB|nr:disulfide bond formation protein B [Gammaproteobacteria bacterium]